MKKQCCKLVDCVCSGKASGIGKMGFKQQDAKEYDWDNLWEEDY